jgi:hypothetical protein
MLHIHNGDSTAETARRANIPGEHIAWREALVCGPVPGNLDEAHFLETRAQHLSTAYDLELPQVRNELRKQHHALSSFRDHEEVVLWFEHDLFCQVNLIYLLNWFAQRDLADMRLSLICINEFPGVPLFRGLGELNEAQLASLFPQRKLITTDQFALATRAWQAYASSDPLGLISVREADSAALPFLNRAIMNHLQRFPWTGTGIGRVEKTALRLAADGRHDFKDLFQAFNRSEGEYGFGDAQLFATLTRLADAGTPLLQRNGGNSTTDSSEMLTSSFTITSDGKKVLAGEQDFVAQNGIDQWLGGVHLRGAEAPWRWDDEAKTLLQS